MHLIAYLRLKNVTMKIKCVGLFYGYRTSNVEYFKSRSLYAKSKSQYKLDDQFVYLIEEIQFVNFQPCDDQWTYKKSLRK